MNERIQELARQAGIITEVWKTDSVGNGYKVPNYEAEKFAELIVRECSRHVEDKFDFCGDEIIIAEEILKHFGVEE